MKSMVTQEEFDRKELPSVEETNGGEEGLGEKKASVTKLATALSRQKLQEDQEEMAALGDLPGEIQEMLKVSKMMKTGSY